MARSIYNVDFYSLVDYRHILCENGDTPFTLEVVVVKYELSEVFRLTDKVGLINHPVNQRSLAVVNVGDDCYVSDILHILLKSRKDKQSFSKYSTTDSKNKRMTLNKPVILL